MERNPGDFRWAIRPPSQQAGEKQQSGIREPFLQQWVKCNFFFMISSSGEQSKVLLLAHFTYFQRTQSVCVCVCVCARFTTRLKIFLVQKIILCRESQYLILFLNNLFKKDEWTALERRFADVFKQTEWCGNMVCPVSLNLQPLWPTKAHSFEFTRRPGWPKKKPN